MGFGILYRCSRLRVGGQCELGGSGDLTSIRGVTSILHFGFRVRNIAAGWGHHYRGNLRSTTTWGGVQLSGLGVGVSGRLQR